MSAIAKVSFRLTREPNSPFFKAGDSKSYRFQICKDSTQTGLNFAAF